MNKENYKNIIEGILKKDGDMWVIDMPEARKLHSEDPNDYDPTPTQKDFVGFSVKINTKRYKVFPDRLPVDKLPHPVDEHDRMGLYENNRDIYLTIANAYNICMEHIENLEKSLQELQTKVK